MEDNGFIVDTFYDPLLALSNYKAGFYDLLLLDVRMPGMSGFEFCQKVKEVDNEAKVCFISAFEGYLEEVKKVFPTVDTDCFIRKPTELQNLVEIVKSKI